MTPELARKIVPWTRITMGLALHLTPRQMLRTLVLNPRDNPDHPYMLWLLGSRAILLGAISAGLMGDDPARRTIRFGAFMDIYDIGAVIKAHRSGRMSTRVAAYNGGFGLAFSALGFLASSQPPDPGTTP